MKDTTEKVIESCLASLKGEILQELSEEEAIQYVTWIRTLLSETIKDRKEKVLLAQIKKCKEEDIDNIKKLKKKKKTYMPLNYPKDLKIGDIVYVNFGYGYCNEISKGHYGIILSNIRANMYLTLPLSSEPLKAMPIGLTDLGLPNAEGLKVGKISYLCFDQLRYLHYRRIEKIKGISDGIIPLSSEKLKFVMEKVQEFLDLGVDKIHD